MPILRSLLTHNTPTPGKVGHTTGVFYSFRTVESVPLRPTRTRYMSAVRRDPAVFVLI